MIKIEETRVFNFEGALRGLRNPKNSWHLSDSFYGIGDDDEIRELAGEAAYSYVDQEMNLYAEDDYEDWVSYRGWLLTEGNGEVFGSDEHFSEGNFIGKKDLKLAQKMVLAGTDESKFMRQIFVSFDLTAPLYWWKEFDTYKVGTVANSCSTMHKLDNTPIYPNNFSFDGVEKDLAVDWQGWPIDEWPEDDKNVEPEFIPHSHIEEIQNQIVENCEYLRLMYKKTGDKQYWRALVQILPNAWNQKRTITLNYQVLRAMYFARKNHKLTEWHEFCEWIENLPYAKELICVTKGGK
jgi:hypothetical protein